MPSKVRILLCPPLLKASGRTSRAEAFKVLGSGEKDENASSSRSEPWRAKSGGATRSQSFSAHHSKDLSPSQAGLRSFDFLGKGSNFSLIRSEPWRAEKAGAKRRQSFSAQRPLNYEFTQIDGTPGLSPSLRRVEQITTGFFVAVRASVAFRRDRRRDPRSRPEAG